MGSIILSLLINGLMAALLLITILYCWRLNKRIQVLQDSRGELARIIREFDESTQRATDSIAEIHEATRRISENIQHKIDKANFLATDLEMMIERGNKMAGRPAAAPAASTGRPGRVPMQESVMAGAHAEQSTRQMMEGEVQRRPANRPRSRAEQELMNVLGKKDESGR